MNQDKKSILVTGSTGFFGSRICAYFKDSYQVIAPTHAELDITDFESIKRLFENKRPDFLIHCVAISDVVECGKDEDKSYAINVTGAENFAKMCALYGTKMIFCSSDQIYFEKKSDVRDRKIVPHKENDAVDPYNIYGRQKLEAEQKIMHYSKDAVCLRLSWMYDTKKLVEHEHSNFYLNVKANLEQGKVCSFPTHDVRGITYVGDAVKNLQKVFLLPGGIYNYGAENKLSTFELLKALFAKKGIPEYAVEPNFQLFQENPRNISMDTSKLRSYGIEFASTLDGLVYNWK